MGKSRIQNAVRNIGWGMIEKIITLLMPFVTRTVLIKVLGAEYLGLNSLFSSILQVLSITELGLGSAIVFSMYRPIEEGDNDTLCALINVYRKIYLIVGSIILAAGLVITPFLPNLIKGTYPNDINIYVLYLIYLFNTVIGYYLWGYNAALFSAHQRNDLVSKRNTIVSLVAEVFKIALLLFICNYYAYVIIFPLATILTNILNALLANKMFPSIKCRGSISSEMKTGLKKRIVGLVSFKIYNVVFTSVDTIVISAFLGLTPLAIYNNYYYIQTALVGFLTIFTSSITAGVGSKMVTNSPDDNYVDFKRFTFVNGWIVSWCSICLVCLYQHFMQWWVGEELVFPFQTMLLMVLYFFIPRITTLTYTYREAAGLWWEDRFRPLVSTVANLAINIALVQVIGIDGVILSTLFCSLFINIPWGSVILFKNYFKRSTREYFMQLLFYTLVTAIVGFVTLFICNLLPGIGLLPMFGKGLICLVVPNILLLLIYHRLLEFEYMKSLLMMIKRKLIKKIGDR